MSITSSNNDAILAEIVRFEMEVAALSNSTLESNFNADALVNGDRFRCPFAGAAPLMPLRERDLKAMTAMFDGEDSDEIEADISYHLMLIWPEPCWEDEPVNFLREYI